MKHTILQVIIEIGCDHTVLLLCWNGSSLVNNKPDRLIESLRSLIVLLALCIPTNYPCQNILLWFVSWQNKKV